MGQREDALTELELDASAAMAISNLACTSQIIPSFHPLYKLILHFSILI